MTNQATDSLLPAGDPVGRANIEVAFQVFFAVIIFLSSVLTNSVVLYAIRRTPGLQTFTNKLIANLCLVDVVETVALIPLWITSLVKGQWIFGNAVCSMAGYIFFALANVTLDSLLFIALSRYFKVVKPQLYNEICGKKAKSRLLLALCWVLPLTVCSPPLYGWGRFRFYTESAICTFEWSFAVLDVTFMAFLVLTQPAPYLICWCYFKIYYAVRRNRIQICTRGNRAACQSAHDAESKFIHTTVAIACVLVICWLPKTIFVLLSASGVDNLRALGIVSVNLVFLACCLNPVVYGILNPQFKPAFKSLLRSRGGGDQQLAFHSRYLGSSP